MIRLLVKNIEESYTLCYHVQRNILECFIFADPKPIVECSFVTEFEDHIFVAMDAELILFLHDLVYMYIKEKDKGQRNVNNHLHKRDRESS